MTTTGPTPRTEFNWELEAQAITLRIRWFGIAVGYVLVNFLTNSPATFALNSILALGAVYALCDTWYSARGRIFLSEYPLSTSAMEAVFIGLLCHFDIGTQSPFRFYYILSLLVCAIRYTPITTYTTFAFHTASYAAVALSQGVFTWDDTTSLVLTPLVIGWVTWAGTSFAGMLKRASHRLTELNVALQHHQAELEERIVERTRELQESQAMIVQQEKQAAFGLLAAGIAHEVGNPLAAISSLVQLLNRRHTDEHTRERLMMVDDQLRRIQRTLRELVDFSRPATNVKAPADIHGMIDSALSIAKYYKRKKGKTIVTSFAAAVPPICVVRDQLVQVLLNLILNAMDATPEGGSIELRTSITGGWLRIDVIDTGTGIAPEHRERIFQPYFTTKETGTGLGLFVCRNIVEQEFGGRIELAATSPAGTTFSVLLTDTALREHPDVAPSPHPRLEPIPQELTVP
ncbi:MAG TPA: ATP-binding protein [Planctomycetaceae bacterium]|nr:ATP-binding protein [Planctomycetaceae bacterium]